MASDILAILQFGLLTFLSAVATGVVIAVCAHLYCTFIRYTGGELQLREQIARYSRLVTGLQERVEQRKAESAGAASVLFSAQRMEKQLRQRLRELEKEPHRFVRVIGMELLPNRPFEVLAINSSVAHQVKRGEKHAFYDSSWARPVQVHIWARGLEEAKIEFERVFPRSTGFKIVHIHPMTMSGFGRSGSPAAPEEPSGAPGPAPAAPQAGSLVPPSTARRPPVEAPA